MAPRKAQRRRVARPAPSRPVTALACPEPERPAPPNPAPVRAGKRRASPRHARSRSPAGKPSPPCPCRPFRFESHSRHRHPVSQPRRCAAGLKAHGARLAVLAMRRHVPHPPTLRSALRRAQPRLVQVAPSRSPWSSVVHCLRLRSSPGGAVGGWSWRHVVPAASPPKPWGAAPNPAPVAGGSGAGGEILPQPSGQRVLAVPRQGCAPAAPGCAGP